MRNWKLSLKLPALAVLAVLLMAAASVVLSLSVGRRVLRAQANQANVNSVQTYAGAITLYLNNARSALEATADLPVEDAAAKHEAAGLLLQHWPIFEYIMLVGADGSIVHIEPHELEAQLSRRDVAFTAWYEQLMSSGQTVVGDLHISTATQRPTVVVATPLRDAQGQIIGIWAGALKLQELAQVGRGGLESGELQRYGEVTDGRGLIIAHQADPRYVQQQTDFSAEPPVRAALQGQSGVVQFVSPVDGVEKLAAYMPLPGTGWAAVYVVPVRVAYAPLDQVTRSLLPTAAAVALLLGLAGVALVRQVTGPLQQLVQGAEEIGRGNLDYTITVSSRDETGQLASAFSEMAANLRRSMEETRQRTEALQQSEEKYRNLAEGLNEVMYRADPQTFVATYVNKSIEGVHGYTAEEWLNDPGLWERSIHPEDRERTLAEFSAAQTKLENAVVSYRIIRKGKTVRWVEDHVTWEKDQQGQVVSMNGLLYDITERRQAQEALQRRVAELSALNTMAAIVNQSPDVEEIINRALDEALRLVGVEAAALFLLDKDTGELAMVAHRAVSAEFARAAGRIKLGEGLVGQVAQTGEPKVITSLDEYPGALKAFLEKERIQVAASVPLLGSTGVIGVMNLGAASVAYFDAAGLQLLVSLGQQIAICVEKARLHTETRRRNRELSVLYTISRATAQSLNLEETLNSALDTTLGALDIEVGGIYLLEPDGETLTLRVVRGVSDETAKNLQRVKLGEGMSGRAAAEKKPFVLDVQDYPSQRLAPYIVQERLQSLASTPLLSGGEAVGAMNLSTRRVRAFPLEEVELLTAIGQQLGNAVQNARLYEAVERELAERKRAEEALQQRTVQLEAANQELEAFTYSVSHDLRAPLRAMDGFSRILLEEYAAQLLPETQRYLQMVQDNVHQMGHLVDDLLHFSRLSRQLLNRQPVAPAGLMREALEELHAEQEGRNIELTIGDLPTCHADPALLKQVFVNLLSNALKFTRKREVARIEVGSLPIADCRLQIADLGGSDAKSAIYFVRDNGVGFDMRYADKLFGVFQRLHRAEEYEGTGVGLAIVQRIIRRHGGRVWAEAELDKGATFYFTI